ncbi:MAG: hypothetical protein LBQ72_01830 [Flavobacteriales bacterium]|jgi:hypothetical protein|uniref:hypothetical protein n=1 Tax=Blattabacterium sp. (Mastotermes darwiniensis) TaxID=39768 RepID=UPI0002DECB66|nr:hypothetical protein [Blattabacterium sp. (Mastotermes darwiniensis)]MDR1804940.1 hypothetical protein [Flavobacteriales bacterium]
MEVKLKGKNNIIDTMKYGKTFSDFPIYTSILLYPKKNMKRIELIGTLVKKKF